MPLSKKAIENKKAYTMEYAKKKYKRVPLDLTIEKYNELKEMSSKNGETVNGFIKKAIDMRLNSL